VHRTPWSRCSPSASRRRAGRILAERSSWSSPAAARSSSRSSASTPGCPTSAACGRRAEEEDVAGVVRGIVADVRARGDEALIELTNKFDRSNVSAATLRLRESEIAGAQAGTTAQQRTALSEAARRIEAYHRRQIPADERFTDAAGVTLGWRWTPLDSVGLYVPGGTASYPSSVLMNAIPARVAGVSRIVMVTPASGGTINPLVLEA